MSASLWESRLILRVNTRRIQDFVLSLANDSEYGCGTKRRVLTPVSVADSSIEPYNAELCHLLSIDDRLVAESVRAKSERFDRNSSEHRLSYKQTKA